MIIALVLLVAAVILYWLAQKQGRGAGLPAGRIIYADSKTWGKPEKPYYDPRSGLTGKPDYVVKQGKHLLPVEVKSAYAPPEPYASHLMQLTAYCLLIERATGNRPPYGLLRYRNRTFAIDYTPEREEALLEIMDEMRRLETRGRVSRSHEESFRCSRCGYAKNCAEKIS